MIEDCSPETADWFIADAKESQRLTVLCDHELIREILETELPDDLYVQELLARLDPCWMDRWGETEQGH